MGLYCSVTLVVDTIQQITFTDCSEVGNFFIEISADDYGLEKFKDTTWLAESLNRYFSIYNYPLKAEALAPLSRDDAFKKLQMENTYEIALVQLPNFYHALFMLGWNESSEYQLIDFMKSDDQNISTESLFYENYGIPFEDAWVGTIEIKKIKR